MDSIEELKKAIEKASDEQINTIPRMEVKTILGLSDEQINTVSFVFWLVYLVEVQLYEMISESWNLSKKLFPENENVQKMAKQILEKQIPSRKKVNVEKLDYFTDKIKVFEAIFGQNEYVKFLYDLRDLRNDISHNRIKDLKYKNMSLHKRTAKENIIIDSIELALGFDKSESKFWNDLSETFQFS